VACSGEGAESRCRAQPPTYIQNLTPPFNEPACTGSISSRGWSCLARVRDVLQPDAWRAVGTLARPPAAAAKHSDTLLSGFGARCKADPRFACCSRSRPPRSVHRANSNPTTNQTQISSRAWEPNELLWFGSCQKEDIGLVQRAHRLPRTLVHVAILYARQDARSHVMQQSRAAHVCSSTPGSGRTSSESKALYKLQSAVSRVPSAIAADESMSAHHNLRAQTSLPIKGI